MARTSYIQIGGKLYDKSLPLPDGVENPERKPSPIYGDLPDFISPIDGKVVSGRAGMREHCRKHDVVPTADLKGLPIGPPRYEPDRAAIKQELIKQLYHK